MTATPLQDLPVLIFVSLVAGAVGAPLIVWVLAGVLGGPRRRSWQISATLAVIAAVGLFVARLVAGVTDLYEVDDGEVVARFVTSVAALNVLAAVILWIVVGFRKADRLPLRSLVVIGLPHLLGLGAALALPSVMEGRGDAAMASCEAARKAPSLDERKAKFAEAEGVLRKLGGYVDRGASGCRRSSWRSSWGCGW
jgi:hypothetical protein